MQPVLSFAEAKPSSAVGVTVAGPEGICLCSGTGDGGVGCYSCGVSASVWPFLTVACIAAAVGDASKPAPDDRVCPGNGGLLFADRRSRLRLATLLVTGRWSGSEVGV